jgi:hypothetical protein
MATAIFDNLSFQADALDIDLENPINWEHPLAQGLRGWWMAVPGLIGGNRLFDLTQRTHGVFNNGPIWRPIPHRGGVGALTFPGGGFSDVYVRMAALRQFSAPPLTIISWFNPTSTATAYKALFGGYSNAYPCLFATSGNASGRPLGYGWEDTSDEYNAASGLVSVVNQWNFAALVVTSSDATLWLATPGAQQLSSFINTKTHNAKTISDCLIGGDRPLVAGNHDFPGMIADTRIFSRAFSPAVIRWLYVNSQLGYPELLNRYSRRYVPSAVVAAARGTPILRSGILESSIIGRGIVA